MRPRWDRYRQRYLRTAHVSDCLTSAPVASGSPVDPASPKINEVMLEACNGLVNKDAFKIKKKKIRVTNVSAILSIYLFIFAAVAATPQSRHRLSHPLACDISPIFTATNKKTLLVWLIEFTGSFFPLVVRFWSPRHFQPQHRPLRSCSRSSISKQLNPLITTPNEPQKHSRTCAQASLLSDFQHNRLDFHPANAKQRSDSRSERSHFAHKKIWIHFWQLTSLIVAYLHHRININ